MVSNTAIGVHGGGKRFDQNTCMGRGRVDPPGETRMPVPLGKRKDHVFHESKRLLEWVSFPSRRDIPPRPPYRQAGPAVLSQAQQDSALWFDLAAEVIH